MKKLALMLVTLLVCVTLVYAQAPEYDWWVYLPVILRSGSYTPSLTPTPTSTPTPTLHPTYTPTPTTTPTPTPTTTPTLEPRELTNGDFEDGLDGSWAMYLEGDWGEYGQYDPRAGCLVNTFMNLWGMPVVEGHGSWLAWLGDATFHGGGFAGRTTRIEQRVTVPQGGGTLQQDVALCFEYQNNSYDYWNNNVGGDTVTVLFNDTPLTIWNVTYPTSGDWIETCIDMDEWRGQTVILKFEMVTDFIWRGDCYIDNVEFGVTPSLPTATSTPMPTITPTP